MPKCAMHRTIVSPLRAAGFALLLVSGIALAQPAPSRNTAPAPTASAAQAAGEYAFTPPEELSTYGPSWQLLGSGVLRFFGFKVYDAILWLPNAQAPHDFKRPFALDIRYATSVKGSDIANTSLIELQRISPSSPEQITAWAKFMNEVFVDVKSGDRLVGVHLPGTGMRLFLNGKLIGETPDVAFSEAFFRIWLDAKTKRPDLRTALLGRSGPEAK